MLAIRKVSSVELVLLKPPLYSKKKKKILQGKKYTCEEIQEEEGEK